MAYALQQAIRDVQLNDYVTLGIVTAIGYDYTLMFLDEIEFIWNKPWSRVSTLYVLTRYFGLCNIMIYTIWGSSFIPGPVQTYVFMLHITPINDRAQQLDVFIQIVGTEGSILNVFGIWVSFVFIGAAELAMILRVWALYGRSRLILGSLLTLYAIEMITYVIACIWISKNQPVVIAIQVLDFTFCAQQNGSPIWAETEDTFLTTLFETIDGAQLTLGALMCLLVVIQFIRESLRMYTARNQLQLNRYMCLLAWEGMIYFLATLTFAIVDMLIYTRSVSTDGWWIVLLGILEAIPPYTLVPRLILSLRKLYARDLRGSRSAFSDDTAFGSVLTSSDDASASGIIFADVGLGEELAEEMEMERREIHGSAGSGA